MHDPDDGFSDYEGSARQHTPWRRVLGLFAPHFKALLVVLTLIVIAGIAGATAPFLMRGIIDDALPASNSALLVWLCAGLIGVAILSAIASVLQAYVSTHIGQQIMHELRVRLYEHLQSLSLAFFATARYQFSGGERQRLSLARTVLRNPRVLLLDEATSALDPQTENALSAALAARHNRTVVSIAHRLSTIRHADQIVVLEGGRIVETGTHDQLITANGRYRQLATIG